MTEKFFKSSGQKSFIEVLSIMDTGKKASTSTPAGKGTKSKATKSNNDTVSTKKMKVQI